RKRALDEMGAAESDPPFPWLLVFVDDLRAVHADPAIRMALADGRRLRTTLLGLADDLASVPGGCGGVAAVEGRGDRGKVSYGEASGVATRGDPGQVRYGGSSGGLAPLQCAPDAMDVDRAERLARA